METISNLCKIWSPVMPSLVGSEEASAQLNAKKHERCATHYRDRIQSSLLWGACRCTFASFQGAFFEKKKRWISLDQVVNVIVHCVELLLDNECYFSTQFFRNSLKSWCVCQCLSQFILKSLHIKTDTDQTTYNNTVKKGNEKPFRKIPRKREPLSLVSLPKKDNFIFKKFSAGSILLRAYNREESR